MKAYAPALPALQLFRFLSRTALAGMAMAAILGSVAAAPTPSGPSVGEPDSASASEAASADGLVGHPVPDWGPLHFVEAPTGRTPADFHGHVTVIRFWTSNCPRCRASAVTLRDWTRRYRDRGLVVVGIYLPKSPLKNIPDREVRDAAHDIALDAVLAVDPEWDALRRLWKNGGPRHTVSVSLLVDRDGIVRAVHRGGRMSSIAPPDQKEEFESFAHTLAQEFASI